MIGIAAISVALAGIIYIERNYKDVSILREMGVKFQFNFGSIVGVYGNGPKKNVKRLIRDNVVDLIGTDSHSQNYNFKNIEKFKKKLSKVVDKNYLNDILEGNAKRNFI